MSIHESEDEFEVPGLDSPPPLSDLLLRPFRNVIGTPQSIFLDRVTRSRSSAIPPLRNPINDFLDAEELALQNAETASTPPLAPRVQNLGAVRETLFSDVSEAQNAEIRFSFADMARLLEVVPAKVQQPPPFQLPKTFGNIPAPRIPTPTSIPTLLVPQSGYLETTTVQSKFFGAMIKFSNFGKDNRDNMETFQVALGECDLLTLANGQRTVPILTTRNPGGYSGKTLIFKDDMSL